MAKSVNLDQTEQSYRVNISCIFMYVQIFRVFTAQKAR